jgi:prevent-host-death family protein
MSLKVSVNQLQQQLPELLDRTVEANDVCLIERNGQPYAVLVSIHEWRRQTIGKRLDALGPSYRLSSAQQKRAEELLTRQENSRLTRREQRELNELLRESEAVMLRRTEALERV